MSIWIHEKSKVLIQGITGKQGTFHGTKMDEYNTDVVGGVTPGKGGQFVELPSRKVPVFNTVAEGLEDTGDFEDDAVAVTDEGLTNNTNSFNSRDDEDDLTLQSFHL